MVTKKTSKEDVKEVSEVSNKTSGAQKATKKKTGKPAAKAKSTATKETLKVSSIPNTANTDVVSSVLETKAKNTTKKAKTFEIKDFSGEEKGAKAVAPKAKRNNIKEKAQQAESKKFMELKKEDSEAQTCPCCCSILCGVKSFFGAWLDAYKKIFDYKTRTSRYDFWAYMLINLFISLFLSIMNLNTTLQKFDTGEIVSHSYYISYWILSFVMLFTSLAIFVRRLHDMGVSGWKGFFRPMTYSVILLFILAIVADVANVADLLFPTDYDLQNANPYLANAISLSALVLFFINFYYLLKTFIAVGFMEGEPVENSYGLPIFADDCTKAKVLRYSTWYFMIFITYVILMFTIVFYLTVSTMMSGYKPCELFVATKTPIDNITRVFCFLLYALFY